LTADYQIMMICIKGTGNSGEKPSPLLRAVFVVTTLAVTACLMAVPAMAHPPSDMTIAYDKGSQQLAVTITHQVDDPKTHYVRDVLVSVNGNVISNPTYHDQPAKDAFTYTYTIPAKDGDTLQVTADCVLAGSTSRTYTLPAQAGTAPSQLPPPSPVPTARAATGFLPLAGAALIILGMRK
jgi:hypothetical protein